MSCIWSRSPIAWEKSRSWDRNHVIEVRCQGSPHDEDQACPWTQACAHTLTSLQTHKYSRKQIYFLSEQNTNRTLCTTYLCGPSPEGRTQIWWGKENRAGLPWCMHCWHHPAVLQSGLVFYGCLSERVDQKRAVEWVVWQQKLHRRVGQGAMMSLEAVLNQI